MIIYPCMCHKDGMNLLFSMCNSMNVNAIVDEMNEQLAHGVKNYKGFSLAGIEYFYAGEPYKTDMSLYD